MNLTPSTLLQAGRVVAGAGSLSSLPALAREFGARRLLIVTGRRLAAEGPGGTLDQLQQALQAAGCESVVAQPTAPEPTDGDVEAVMASARAAGAIDLVVGLGGGSAIDVAKIVAVMLRHPITLRELLAKVPVPGRGVPTVLVPTTSGTGAEATPNSIILVEADASKVGIVSPWLLPDAVILDPLLTLSVPPDVTAATGMDALTHAIECYCSKKGTPFSDFYALEAIRLISGSLSRAFHNGHDVPARAALLMGSYYGGVCIATSSTTAVHALAYPLGGKYRVPHGLSNAMLLPTVMAFNAVGNETRFAAMARAMGLDLTGCDDGQASQRFVHALRELNTDLGVPNDLKTVGVQPEDLDALVAGAAKVTRLLDNNPRPMSTTDMRAIYEQLM
jgi:alcohol dehydrogenase